MILASSAKLKKCEFCRNPDENEVVPLNRILPKVRHILGIQLNDEDENATVCTVCIITLNQMAEKRQNMRASFYKKKANSSYIKGDSNMAKMYLSQASTDTTFSKEDASIITNTIGNGLKITDVRSQVEFNNSCDENCYEERELTIGAEPVENEKPENGLLVKPMNDKNLERITENIKHKPSVILTCNECFKNFKSQHHFNKHKMMHRRRKSAIESSKNRKFKCPECSVMFNIISELRTHSLTHKPTMNCTNCNKIFHAKMELNWHIVECEAKQEIAFSDVDTKTSNRRRTRSVTRNLKQKRSEYSMDDDATSAASSYVDSTYTGRHKLVEKFINERSQLPQEPPQLDHNINYDSDDSDHRSVITNFTSVSQRSGQKQRYYCTIHPYSELIVPLIYVNEFQCHDCRASYSHVTDMMKHEIKKHHLYPMYTCYECYTKFTRKNYLEMHELAHRKYFTCHQCQRIFPTRRALRTHLNQHLQKSYECIRCSRSFLTVTELKQHMYYDRHENNLKNLKIKKFIKTITNNRSRTPRIVYRAYEMIQPICTKDTKTSKRKIYKISKPKKIRLYNGFYEKIENIEPQQMFVYNKINHIVEHIVEHHHDHTIEAPVEQYNVAVEEDADNGDKLTDWNFDDNFDFQLFSVESLQGPPSNESLNDDFDFFHKLDTINPKRVLSYTEVMGELENRIDF